MLRPWPMIANSGANVPFFVRFETICQLRPPNCGHYVNRASLGLRCWITLLRGLRKSAFGAEWSRCGHQWFL